MGMKWLLSILILSLTISIAKSQDCSGNFGRNLFADGDFGTGIENILLTDPGIAPGYAYTPFEPVSDGEYALTNSTVPWNGINGWGWARIGDNSPNPNGYMMLVNASYEPGLFYLKQIDGLCDNTLFEFTADIYNMALQGSNRILPNVDFMINGSVVYSTVDIPENERWNKYGFNFRTYPGQNSVTLALRNNAPGGIGNDLAIDNIRFRACGPTAEILPQQTAFVCEDSADILLYATVTNSQYNTPQIQWQTSNNRGITWFDIPGATDTVYAHTQTAGGVYYYRYLIANSLQNLNNTKCRIESNVKIVRVTPKFTLVQDTICEGMEVQFGLNTYNSSGRYTDSLITKAGCDSVVSLDLVVVPDRGIETVIETESPSCTGFTDGIVSFPSILDGSPPFEITIDSTILDGVKADFLGKGIYDVHIRDKYGCEADTSFEIIDPEPFFIDLGPDLSIDLGDSVELKVNSNYGIDGYHWQPLTLTNCQSGCDSIKVLPRGSTLILLSARSREDCQARDSIYIEVKEKREVFIPDVFTPNGDAYNDFFTIQGSFPKLLTIEEMIIYNRWENEVFNSGKVDLSKPFEGWDGRFKGKPLPSGVYYYNIRLRFLDEEVKEYQGYVHLMR